ncbi:MULTISPECIES: DsbA family protein [Pandoraea]|uniref:DsbA family protein n=1 Tax=Pandoraea TaxID=93217 RepID=UPI0003D1EA2C|nr:MULTISPECIES: DsbA family protein [Pandoraea]AHB76123.1 protein-disulfide isomerase [Pandoraea pnomenusa]QDX20003.1 DsbA family protein [Pandoraea pnomenusa]
MTYATLHYIADPLCGWCYAAAPLVRAARDVAGLDVALHGGGMMAGPNAQPVTPQLRSYVMPHDHRIAELTGQPFGDAYFDGLLRDGTAVFDSAPPTAAALAAEALAGRGLDMFAAMQRAHYVDGKRIAERDVLVDIAADLGLDRAAFAKALDAVDANALMAHFRESRAWLARVGGSGFPTFALEIDGRLERLEPGRYLGQPDAWRDALRERLMAAQATSAAAGDAAALPQCGPDGCTI